MNEVLLVAGLAMVSGAIWHWSGWLGWPTEPERKPLGRMGPVDALGGFVVYLVAQFGALALFAVYRTIKFQLEHPGSKMAAPMTDITPMEALVIMGAASIPLIGYFGARCMPRQGEAGRQTGLETKGFWRLLLLGVTAGVTVIPIVLLINNGMQELGLRVFDQERPSEGHALFRILRESPTVMNYTAVALSAVLLAPLMEELLFRGMLQGSLRPLGRGVAVTASATMFAMVHLGSVPWQVLPALGALGVVLSVMFERTGVIWPGMVAHATFNACNLVIAIWFVTPVKK
jgi:membrane protease YdiL (CAAX protease family)